MYMCVSISKSFNYSVQTISIIKLFFPGVFTLPYGMTAASCKCMTWTPSPSWSLLPSPPACPVRSREGPSIVEISTFVAMAKTECGEQIQSRRRVNSSSAMRTITMNTRFCNDSVYVQFWYSFMRSYIHTTYIRTYFYSYVYTIHINIMKFYIVISYVYLFMGRWRVQISGTSRT